MPTKYTQKTELTFLTRHRSIAPLLIIISISFLCYTTQLGRTPGIDELFIHLAAKNFMLDGTLSILDGEYIRAPLFTKFIGYIYFIFDNHSLYIGRLVSVFFNIFLCISIFYWTRLYFGDGPAFISAVLFIFWPFSIYMAQTLRYYPLQAFFIFNSAMLLFFSTTSSGKKYKRFLAFLFGITCMLAALYLQSISIVFFACIFLWLSIALYLPNKEIVFRNIRIAFVLFLFSIFLAIYLAFDNIDYFYSAVRTFRFSPPWTQWRNELYYLSALRDGYPSLLAFSGFFFLYIIAIYPLFGLLYSIIIITVITTMSFAGIRDTRYIYAAMPFLFIVFSIPMYHIILYIYNLLKIKMKSNSLPGTNFAPLAAIVFCACFMVALNPAIKESFKWMRDGGTEDWSDFWDQANKTVKNLSTQDSIVITDADVETIYYIGDFDYHFSSSALFLLSWLENIEEKEFTNDFRTGRATIGNIDSLLSIIEGGGLVVIVARRELYDRFNDLKRRLDFIETSYIVKNIGDGLIIIING